MTAISDDDTDVLNPGGFTGYLKRFPYGRLYNLYLDPKETRSYMIRKLAYLEALQNGVVTTCSRSASIRRSAPSASARNDYERSISWIETPCVEPWLMRASRAPGQMLASGSETVAPFSRR